MRRTTVLALVPFLALGALLPSQANPSGPATPGILALETFAPPDVFAFASFAGLEECSAACTELGLYRLWQEPEVQGFLREALDCLAQAAQEPPAGALEQWGLAKELLGGRVSLVLGGLNLVWTRHSPVPMPGLVLALDIGAKRARFHGVVEQLRSSTGPGSPFRAFEQEIRIHKGREICVLSRTRSAPHLNLCFTYVDNLVLFGLNETLLLRCLDNLATPKATLADLPAFRRARSKTQSKPLLELFIHLDALAERVQGLVPDEWRAAIQTLGLDGIHGLYYASSISDGHNLDTLYLDAPAPRRGLLDLSPRPIGPESLAFVPKDATHFEAAHVDIGSAWDTVMSVLPGILPPRPLAELSRRIDQVQQELGLPLREGLLDALGTELIHYLHLRPHALIPDMVLSVEVKEREPIEKLLGIVVRRLQLEVREVPFRGQTMHIIQIPDQTPTTPAFAFLGNRLVFSLNPAGLKAAIARHGLAQGSIQESPAFQEVFHGLGIERAHGIQYLDTRPAVELFYGLAETLLPGLSGQLPLPVDFSLLPSREVVSAHAPAWCSTTTGDPDGILMRGRTLGAASLLAVLSRVLDQTPGVPPLTLERMLRELGLVGFQSGPVRARPAARPR